MESGDRAIAFDDAEDFLLAQVPEFGEEYENLFPPDIREGVTHVVFGAFAGWVSKELAPGSASTDVDLARRIFDTIEALANSDDPRTENLVRVGFLERLLAESPDTIELARMYYGPRTSLLDHEITAYWETFEKNRPLFNAIRRLMRDLTATGVRFAIHYELTDLGDDWGTSNESTSPPSVVTGQSPSWRVSLKLLDLDVRFELVVTGVSDELILVRLASDLQARIALELFSRWPSCPRHDHSLEPRIENARAIWRCPVDRQIEASIGNVATLLHRL